MYVIDINVPNAKLGDLPGISNAAFPTIQAAHDTLTANGFVLTPQYGGAAYIKGDILAVISRYHTSLILGKEEVELR